MKKLIKAFWVTGKEEYINKYVRIDPTLIIHLTSLSDMTDNKKTGRQSPGERTRHQVIKKGPEQIWSSVSHIKNFLCAVLPWVFFGQNSSISLLRENNHRWLSHLNTMRTHKYPIRKMRGAVQPTFRFICYSYNFNIQFCFLQCNLNSCTDRRLANIRSSFCHLNFTQISSYSQKI